MSESNIPNEEDNSGTAVDVKKTSEINVSDIQRMLIEVLGDVIVTDINISLISESLESFGKSVFKIDATIQKTSESTLEKIHTVAKIVPFLRSVDASVQDTSVESFLEREINFYKVLLPAYREVEKRYGLWNERILSIAPDSLGARLSRNPEATEVDTGALLLLENLEHRGYYKIAGDFDIDHAKVAVRSLAKFHAIGILVNQDDRAYDLDVEVFEYNTTDIRDMIRPILRDTKFRKHAKAFNAALCECFKNDEHCFSDYTDLLTICHGQIGAPQNFLFHRDENGKVDNAVLVDFQDYFVSSPCRDLSAFLCVCLRDDVVNKRVNEIIATYFDEFKSHLAKMDALTETFSKHAFEEQLRIASILEFPMLSSWCERNPAQLHKILKLFLYKKWIGD